MDARQIWKVDSRVTLESRILDYSTTTPPVPGRTRRGALFVWFTWKTWTGGSGLEVTDWWVKGSASSGGGSGGGDGGGSTNVGQCGGGEEEVTHDEPTHTHTCGPKHACVPSPSLLPSALFSNNKRMRVWREKNK